VNSNYLFVSWKMNVIVTTLHIYIRRIRSNAEKSENFVIKYQREKEKHRKKLNRIRT
jgi:hypothetical protein